MSGVEVTFNSSVQETQKRILDMIFEVSVQGDVEVQFTTSTSTPNNIAESTPEKLLVPNF